MVEVARNRRKSWRSCSALPAFDPNAVISRRTTSNKSPRVGNSSSCVLDQADDHRRSRSQKKKKNSTMRRTIL
eukprot:47268-Prymnesium_polylepis.1